MRATTFPDSDNPFPDSGKRIPLKRKPIRDASSPDPASCQTHPGHRHVHPA
jgi:hypothetical protein